MTEPGHKSNKINTRLRPNGEVGLTGRLKQILPRIAGFRRTGGRRKHKRLLHQLKRSLTKRYYPSSDRNAGDPLYKHSPEDHVRLERYFRAGHFHKNFYANYHALYRLFSQPQVTLPDVVCVYDLACGPYTATLSVMNYVNNAARDLSLKSFALTFCDMGDLCLSKLYQSNAAPRPRILFPADLHLFDAGVSRGTLTNVFHPRGYKIAFRQCRRDHEHRCGTSAYPHIDRLPIRPASHDHGINIVFCSFPGTYGEPKFPNCIRRTLAGFSPTQKQYPTYVIYSHYARDRYDATHDVSGMERTKAELMTALRGFCVKSVVENDETSLTVSRYFYIIIEL